MCRDRKIGKMEGLAHTERYQTVQTTIARTTARILALRVGGIVVAERSNSNGIEAPFVVLLWTRSP